MTELVEKRAEMLEEDLKHVFEQLPRGRRVSFTFDGWTSSNMTPFVAITCHFVTKDWKLSRSLLSFAELSRSHNAKNIAKHFYCVLSNFGLTDKVCTFLYSMIDFSNNCGTTDNEHNQRQRLNERCRYERATETFGEVRESAAWL